MSFPPYGINRVSGAEKIGFSMNDSFVASALVRQGVVPCSLISPTVTIAIKALELYRIAYYRNPHFSIQAFVKTLCDVHGVRIYLHPLSVTLISHFKSPVRVSALLVSPIFHRL